MSSTDYGHLPEVFSGFGVFTSNEVPHPYGIPTDWSFGFPFHKLVSEEEKLWMEMWDMLHACEVDRECRWVEISQFQDSKGIFSEQNYPE